MHIAELVLFDGIAMVCKIVQHFVRVSDLGL